MYPRLEVNITKLKHNAKVMLNLCQENHIPSCFLVSKVLAGNKKIVESLYSLGFSHLAESRIENLKTYQRLPIPKVLVRIPMKTELKQVVKYADCSLQSELETIKLISLEAIKQNKKHQIILMFDLGDLREGIYITDDYLSIIEEILTLEAIELLGIGTNLTCFGGIIPSMIHLSILLAIKNTIESTCAITIKLISAGNSSMIHLLDGTLPIEINNIRIGEAIFLGKETSYGQPVKDMVQDAFILKAKIVEIKDKPSYPIGEQGVNSFGEKPHIEDKGTMRRAIVALGKQDVDFNHLYPLDSNITILGGSSDHLIIDVTQASYTLYDTLSFSTNYPGLLHLMTSKYVKKIYKQ